MNYIGGSRGDHIDRGIRRAERVYDQDGLEHMSEEEGRELADKFDFPLDIDDILKKELDKTTKYRALREAVDDVFKESN